MEIGSVGIIGAGLMGSGIAEVCARNGIRTLVTEAGPDELAAGQRRVNTSLERGRQTGKLSEEDLDRITGLLTFTTRLEDFGECDFCVEAIVEQLPAKVALFGQLDHIVSEEAILATNTSTLDIDQIAAATSRPQQVVGTHFFSPANVMKLLENVRGAKSSPQTLATVMALGKTLGKVPVLAGNCDGFIGNRMLGFYGQEAEFLLEEGATPEQIDRVIEGFGFAMGPLAVRDLAGNDVGFLIRKGRKLPADERYSPILERLVALGRLGQKTGKGFYRYEGRTRIPDPEVTTLIEGVSRDLKIQRRQIADQEILDRLLHPLVNEGARIVEEGIAARASDIDVVYVNGYGFPAWRGGPMYWAQHAGLERVVKTMRGLASSHGARWAPAALLERLAASGQGWNDDRKT
jgi:3-hydroxyacyl-CoA dehydrogenase